jgi:hypothetical protein
MKTLFMVVAPFRQSLQGASESTPVDWEAVFMPLFLLTLFLLYTNGVVDMWRTVIRNRAWNPIAIGMLATSTVCYGVTVTAGATAMLNGELF